MSHAPGGPSTPPTDSAAASSVHQTAPAHADGSFSSSAAPSDALLFLLEMFPARSSASLERTLVQAGGALDAAVQACLAQEEQTDAQSAASAAAAAAGAQGGSAEPFAPVAEAGVSLVPVAVGQNGSDDEAEEKADEDLPAADVVDMTDESKEDRTDASSSSSAAAAAGVPVRTASPLRASVSDLHALLSGSSSSRRPPPPVSSYLSCVRTLLHCISNVLDHPLVEKYRLLPYGHDKFRARIGGPERDERLLQRALALLQRVGWTDVAAGAGSSSVDEGFLLLTDRDEATLKHAQALLQAEIDSVQEEYAGAITAGAAAASSSSSSSSRPSSAGAPSGAGAPLPVAAPVSSGSAASSSASASAAAAAASASSLLYMPLAALKKQYKRKEERPASTPRTVKLSREQMAQRVSDRLQGKAPPVAASSAPTVRAGRIMNLSHTQALRAQIDAVRRAKHSRWVSTAQSRKRVYTVADLAAMEEADIKARANFGSGGGGGGGSAGAGSASAPAAPSGPRFKTLSDLDVGGPADCLALGKRMLVLTNEFRAREGKRPLQWHQSLHDIGLVHSKRMALKQVAFGHDGAKQRFAAYPFPAQSAAENVAWSAGHPDVAFCHHSPGHRKNMLAHHTWCAIAVFRNSEGAYYSTQLFGLG